MTSVKGSGSSCSPLARISPLEARTLLAELERADQRDLARNPLRLIRHPRLGIVPLRPFAKQREFIDRYRRVRKVMGWDGPNRAGKSLAASMICMELLTGWPIDSWPDLPWDVTRHPMGPPRSIGCVTISKTKSRDGQQRAIAERIPRGLLACKPWSARTGFGMGSPMCVLRNGSTVAFLTDGQDEQELEQFQFDLVWIDEAVLPWVYDRLIARLIDAGGKMLITAVAEAAWIYRVLRMRVMRPDSLEPVGQDLVDSVTDSTMRDNELLREEDIAAAAKLWGGVESRESRMRIGGQYVHLEGVVFPEYDDIESVVPTRKIPAGSTVYEWHDPGFANPYGVAFAAVTPDGEIEIFDEIYERGMRVPLIAQRIRAIRKARGYEEPYRSVIDEAAEQRQHRGVPVDSYRKELLACNIRTVTARHPPGSLEADNQRVAVLLAQRRLKVQQHCRWTRYEFINHKYAKADPATQQFLGDRERPIDADNHLIAAIRYGVIDGPVWVPLPAAAPPRDTVARDLWEAQQRGRQRKDKPWK